MAPTTPPLRLPLAARLLSGRLFYGWWIAIACTVVMYVTVGVGYYGLALFLKPLREAHGWTNAAVSTATGLFFVFSGVASFLVGPYIDRIGPRRFMATGIVLTAAGASAVGYVNTLWQLYLVYGVLAVAYGIGAAVPVSTLLARWFIHLRARATAISSTGVSLGGATLIPFGTWLIGRGGLELAAPVLGLMVAVVALPVLYLFVSPEPAAMGLQADGGKPPPANARLDLAGQLRRWTRHSAGRTVAFWTIVVGFFLALGAQTAVLINQLAFLQEPDKLGSRQAAALAVTTTTLGSIVARFVVGQFADRQDKRVLAVSLFVLQAGAVVGYVAAGSRLTLYAAAAVFGFTVGNIYMVQSLIVGEIFGMASFGTIYGVVSLSSQVGSGVGLIGVGWLHDRTDGYTVPFLVLAAVDVVAALVVASTRLPAPLAVTSHPDAAPVASNGAPSSAPADVEASVDAPADVVTVAPGPPPSAAVPIRRFDLSGAGKQDSTRQRGAHG